jgi:hypothetical protein
MIRALEAAVRPNTILVFVGGTSDQFGRVYPNSTWGFAFADRSDPRQVAHSWTVYSDGRVVYLGEGGFRALKREIPVSGILDSDAAVKLGKGPAGRYLERYPDAYVVASYTYTSGLPVWTLRFQHDIYLKADTGEFLAADMGCLDR